VQVAPGKKMGPRLRRKCGKRNSGENRKRERPHDLKTAHRRPTAKSDQKKSILSATKGKKGMDKAGGMSKKNAGGV